MNLANKITVIRVCLIPVFLIVYISDLLSEPGRSYIAAAIFVIAAATDAWDGYIARSRNLVTNFGKFADPLADKLLVCAALITMVEKAILPSWVVILIISREFIVTGFRTIAAADNIVIAASYWGKLKTVCQMVMIVYMVCGLQALTTATNYVGQGLVYLTAVLTVVSGLDYIIKNIHVLKE